MEEIWKDIPGYEGLYQVSSLGNIRSYTRKVVYPSGILHTYVGQILKPDVSNGYLRVQLSKNAIKKRCLVHRLVAETFLPNPHNFPQVNHKDENRQNNSVGNLEWCSAAYNINYGARNAKLSKRAKMVKQIDANGHIVAVYKSVTELARQTTYDFSAVYKCCRGDSPSYKGYMWEYV